MSLGKSLTALAALAALLTACGSASSDDPSDPAGAPTGDGGTPEETRVVASAADGTTVAFEDFTVTCRPSEEGQPDARIVSAMAGWDWSDPDRAAPTEPAMLIEAADGTDGTTVQLPGDEEYGKEKTFVVGFITQVGKHTELASTEEQATGTIEVVSAHCDPEPHLEVRIDGVFGSEVADATVTVKGHVSTD